MYLKTAAEIAGATLAVFGLYALFRLFVTARFLPHRRVTLLHVPRGTDAAQLALALRGVCEAALVLDGTPVVCLLEQPACAGVPELLDGKGIRYYQIL